MHMADKTVYYPAVFHEQESGYWVEFPDLPGCLTEGRTDVEAVKMAQDALALYLDKAGEETERIINQPSRLRKVVKDYPDDLVMLVGCDPRQYYRRNHSKAVKKTLTIPEWLNDEAERKNINFSQVLQEAIIDKLGL